MCGFLTKDWKVPWVLDPLPFSSTKAEEGGVQWIPPLLIYLSPHENHFYTSADAYVLLIKFIWAHINHAAKNF